MNGLFITFEGCDGLGKSKQAKLLRSELEARGHKVFATKEPGSGTSNGAGSPLGAVVRESVFHLASSGRTLPPGAQQLYLLLDHIDNVSRFEPYLRDGFTVVCDRYSDSAFSYAVELWQQFFGPIPDITVLLVAKGELVYDEAYDVVEDIGWALNRARVRLDEEAGKQQGKGWNDPEAQRLIQSTYLILLGNQPRTVLIPVEEDDSEVIVHEHIMAGIDQWFAKQKAAASNHSTLPERRSFSSLPVPA
jgi:hypothetical protein